jgi:hypothetical protein
LTRTTHSLCACRLPAVVAGSAAAASAAISADFSTVRLRTGFVHRQRPPIEFSAVKLGNSSIRFSGVAHFDECKPSGLPGVAVSDDIHTIHGTVCREHGSNRIFGSPEAKVPNKNIFHSISFTVAELIGAGSDEGRFRPDEAKEPNQ